MSEFKNLATLLVMTTLSFFPACSDEGEEEKVNSSSKVRSTGATSSISGTTLTTADVPQIGSIQMQTLGRSSISLAAPLESIKSTFKLLWIQVERETWSYFFLGCRSKTALKYCPSYYPWSMSKATQITLSYA